jgi:hypothetical protein
MAQEHKMIRGLSKSRKKTVKELVKWREDVDYTEFHRRFPLITKQELQHVFFSQPGIIAQITDEKIRQARQNAKKTGCDLGKELAIIVNYTH